MCFEFDQLPFLIQCIAAVAASSMAISWAFPIALIVLTLRKKERWAIVAVSVDVLLVLIQVIATMPLIT